MLQVYSNNITGDQLTGFYINGELIIDDEFYTVAAVDYIFDQASYPFGLGKNSVATGILFRDILIKTLEDINNNTDWELIQEVLAEVMAEE
mgnify:CR=1 FL=1